MFYICSTTIYSLSLHDALPIYRHRRGLVASRARGGGGGRRRRLRLLDDRDRDRDLRSDGLQPVAGGLKSATTRTEDRKSTRLNTSYLVISYAYFCLTTKIDIHI